ncbi:MAG: response regulator transcription factor [Candidatus Xenobia bacterium]
MRILVIDDEQAIRHALKSILATRNYEVDLAQSADEAIERCVEATPDLVILDLAMPGTDGFEVCQRLRSWMGAPILVLSVRTGSGDKIRALDLGADDYLTKPFVAGELLARVRALLRRSQGVEATESVITVESLCIDLARRRVTQGGDEVHLTRTEFDILAYLARNADRVVTANQILEHVWGPDYLESRHMLRVHIANLRKKIEPDPSVPRYVVTEPAVGYSFFTT